VVTFVGLRFKLLFHCEWAVNQVTPSDLSAPSYWVEWTEGGAMDYIADILAPSATTTHVGSPHLIQMGMRSERTSP